MEELNVKVGDKLRYCGGSIYNRVEKIVTVRKVTPTGRIRIDCNDSQYDKYGNEMGKGGTWSRYSTLRIPTEEDYKRIKEHNAKAKALLLIRKLDMHNISYEQAVKIIEILEPKGEKE